MRRSSANKAKQPDEHDKSLNHQPTFPPEDSRPEPASGDILQIYFREISRVALLTPKEETALARRIRRGDKNAREHMIKANLRLVVKIAREYEGFGLPLLDLINEGNIGLMKAVDRFKPEIGAKLSTYSSWWIRQAIRRALSNRSKLIRLPVHFVDRLTRIRKTEATLWDKLGREPENQEIADHLGLDAGKIQACRNATQALLSLNSPLGDDQTHTVAETVADENAVIASEQLVRQTDRQLLREVLATLKPREQEILKMRFGLNGDEPKRLEAVGKHFGVTRERIRQIQEQSLAKLREMIEKRNRVDWCIENGQRLNGLPHLKPAKAVKHKRCVRRQTKFKPAGSVRSRTTS